jgi:4-diphosphocytidyl-2-C-methyl-D-erythritol kinase
VPTRVNAYAKINLFLEVHGLRPDGFHDIRSILVPVTLADSLEVELTDGALELSAPRLVQFEGMPDSVGICQERDNLVFKAAKLLRETTGCRHGARILLEKKIPIAGGLGGGSADAAATLLVLNRLWQTNLTRSELMDLSGRLGCDIPALVYGGAVSVAGRGEQVKPVSWRAGWRPWLLLVNPGFGVSTKDVYQRYKQDLTSVRQLDTFENLLAALERGEAAELAAGLHNDLQRTVFNKYPLLEMIADRMAELGAQAVLLSGSGATLFALVRGAEHGRKLAAELRRVMNCCLWTSVVQVTGDLRPEF